MKKNWTLDEEKQLESLLNNKLSYFNISAKLSRTIGSCTNKVRKLRLKSLYKNRLYYHNDNYWSILNIENCYWAGFASADASIAKTCCSFIIELSVNDKEHLEVFKKNCGYTGPILTYNRENRPGHDTVKMAVNSKKWIFDMFTNFGLINNKTKRIAIPVMNDKNLLFSWLKGYYSGDGSVFISGGNIYFTVVSSSENIIKWITTFLGCEFKYKLNNMRKITTENIPGYKKLDKVNCYRYVVTGLRAAIIIDYLRQVPTPNLARKWDRPEVLAKIEQYKQKYPQFFKKYKNTENKISLNDAISVIA